MKGTKRLLSSVLDGLEKQGAPRKEIWDKISDIIVLTLLTIQPLLAHTYRSVSIAHDIS